MSPARPADRPGPGHGSGDEPDRPERRLLIAGGGTAGHLVPAIALARELAARGWRREEIVFVASRRGIESTLVAEAGFEAVLLPGRGIVRGLRWENIAAVAGLAAATLRTLWLCIRRRPRAVVSVGGYAALPCALAAVVLRVPLVIVESNAVAGATHRLVGRFARSAAVAFPDTRLPRAVVTGTPVRPEVLEVSRTPAGRAAAKAELSLPADVPVVAVWGGSLGSRRINDATLGLVEGWPNGWSAGEPTGRPEGPVLALRHVIGARDWEELSAHAERAAQASRPRLVYQPVRYEDRMAVLLAAADLVVSRAGGSTLAELTAVGVPAVLVPLPIAPHDHQTRGARRLAEAGGAVVVPDSELSAARLAQEVRSLFAEPGRLEGMGKAAARLGRRDAASRVAELVERVGDRGRG